MVMSEEEPKSGKAEDRLTGSVLSLAGARSDLHLC